MSVRDLLLIFIVDKVLPRLGFKMLWQPGNVISHYKNKYKNTKMDLHLEINLQLVHDKIYCNAERSLQCLITWSAAGSYLNATQKMIYYLEYCVGAQLTPNIGITLILLLKKMFDHFARIKTLIIILENICMHQITSYNQQLNHK